MACLLFFDVLFAVLVSFVPEGFVVCQAGRVIAAINCSGTVVLLAAMITSYLFMRVTVTRTSAVFFKDMSRSKIRLYVTQI